jgi:hypothetical protein
MREFLEELIIGHHRHHERRAESRCTEIGHRLHSQGASDGTKDLVLGDMGLECSRAALEGVPQLPTCDILARA